MSNLRSLREHYVYVYLDPRPGKKLVPIYVGKGSYAVGKPKLHMRAWSHWNNGSSNLFFHRILLKIKVLGCVPIIKFYDCGRSEKRAFQLEIKLIAKYGRWELGRGTLVNRTAGGDGSSENIISARKTSKRWADPEYARRVGSNISKGLHAYWDSPRSAALRLRLSEDIAVQRPKLIAGIRKPEAKAKKVARGKCEGYRYLVAYNNSPEGKAAIGQKSRQRWADPVWRAKMLAAQQAGKKPHTPEFKETQRLKMLASNAAKTAEERVELAKRANTARNTNSSPEQRRSWAVNALEARRKNTRRGESTGRTD